MNFLGRTLARTPLVKALREDQKKVEEQAKAAKQQSEVAHGIANVLNFFSDRAEFWGQQNHVNLKVQNIVGGHNAGSK